MPFDRNKNPFVHARRTPMLPRHDGDVNATYIALPEHCRCWSTAVHGRNTANMSRRSAPLRSTINGARRDDERASIERGDVGRPGARIESAALLFKLGGFARHRRATGRPGERVFAQAPRKRQLHLHGPTKGPGCRARIRGPVGVLGSGVNHPGARVRRRGRLPLSPAHKSPLRTPAAPSADDTGETRRASPGSDVSGVANGRD